MKKLLSKTGDDWWLHFKRTELFLWITQIVPVVTYSLILSLMPILFVILFTIFRKGDYWKCCQENIQNGELLLVSMSFIASSWFVIMEAHKHPKKILSAALFTSIISILIIVLSVCFIVAQRIYKDLTNLEMISWVTGTTLIFSCLIYGRCIAFKIHLEDGHADEEMNMIDRVGKLVD